VSFDEAVVWHDVECGAYAADLPLWRELAAATGGPVLDLGAGTGRVALDLARAGHDVTALDHDELLLAALRERAGDLPVTAVAADARDFALPARYALCIAPMQTLQLLGGLRRRARCLACVRRHLHPGALFAATLADPFDGFDADTSEPPLPDLREQDGWVYSSQPVTVRAEPEATAIERIRQAVAPDGRHTRTTDTTRLDHLLPGDLEREARAAGLHPEPRRQIPATHEHVGSTVVIARA
jgi:SAM-dependent methyltransferase